MNRADELFFHYLKTALSGKHKTDGIWKGETERAKPGEDLTEKPMIDRVLNMAEIHAVLPMICEVISEEEQQEGLHLLSDNARRLAIRQVSRQILQVADFQELYEQLLNNGLCPVIIKGIAVRHLYPRPYHRPSVDEDILIRPEQFSLYHNLLVENGLELLFPEQDPMKQHEVSYYRRSTGLYIEIHKSLFSQKSGAYGRFNRYFANAYEHSINEKIRYPLDGQALLTGHEDKQIQIYTMHPSQHLFYLVCHCFKHFVHSGIGIRPICDIALFGRSYKTTIDWENFWNNCKKIRAEQFMAAILRIAEEYLGFSGVRNDFDMPAYMKEAEAIDCIPLLQDFMRAGVHGNSSMIRLHSSNVTLRAVEHDRKRGETHGRDIENYQAEKNMRIALNSLFLPYQIMEERYTYLKKAPMLLPVAWAQRAFGYFKEQKSESGTSLMKSIRLGEERIRLLKMYGIIR